MFWSNKNVDDFDVWSCLNKNKTTFYKLCKTRKALKNVIIKINVTINSFHSVFNGFEILQTSAKKILGQIQLLSDNETKE